MSVHFEPIRVREIHKETAECVSIVFDIPDQLKEQFAYKQGQHLTVRAFIKGEEVRRSYSLCSSPLDHEWRVAVKKVDGGIFSTYANEILQKGDTLDLMPPMGHFYTELDPATKKSYTAIVAGSGITPVLSIIKTILTTEPNSKFTLVYGNKSRNSIIFREELEALKNKYLSRLSIMHVLSREMTDALINHGRIDTEKCDVIFEKIADLQSDAFFICGPEAMIFSVKDFLQQKGVDERKIHFELFTAPGMEQQKVKHEVKDDFTKAKSHVAVKLDGIMFDFNVDFDGTGILDAALKQGADLPYSCRGGMCCTCKARLLEGEVNMDVHYGLEPEEIEQGYILVCQSHPRTEKVVIDFDIK